MFSQWSFKLCLSCSSTDWLSWESSVCETVARAGHTPASWHNVLCTAKKFQFETIGLLFNIVIVVLITIELQIFQIIVHLLKKIQIMLFILPVPTSMRRWQAMP